MSTRWDRKFFVSTRGRVVSLLRRAGFTVDGLARELDLTNNGVRAHLAVLERDGIVRQRGSVRRSSGGGKPSYVYELTQEGEDLFPKAYEPTLRGLLDVLADQLGPEESEALLRLVGRRLVGEHSTRADGAHARLEAAVEVLNELGGLAELEERDGALLIRGYSCPLAGVTPDHPEVCRMAETLIAEVAGDPSTSNATVARGLAAASRLRPPATLGARNGDRQPVAVRQRCCGARRVELLQTIERA